MKISGILLVILGIILGIIAMTMDITGGYDVVNLSLMNMRSNLTIGAGIAFISGILLIGFSSFGSTKSDDDKKCPYCAEMIKREAKICKYCNHEQLTEFIYKKEPAEFVDNNNGTVTDKVSGLVWQKCSFGQSWNGTTCIGEAKKFTWHEAMKIKSDFAGKTDWRLPTKNELMQLVYCPTGSQTSPTINTVYFPNTPSSWFWSSLPYAGNSGNAWGIDFYDGGSYTFDKDGSGYVHLVRNGQ